MGDAFVRSLEVRLRPLTSTVAKHSLLAEILEQYMDPTTGILVDTDYEQRHWDRMPCTEFSKLVGLQKLNYDNEADWLAYASSLKAACPEDHAHLVDKWMVLWPPPRAHSEVVQVPPAAAALAAPRRRCATEVDAHYNEKRLADARLNITRSLRATRAPSCVPKQLDFAATGSELAKHNDKEEETQLVRKRERTMEGAVDIAERIPVAVPVDGALIPEISATDGLYKSTSNSSGFQNVYELKGARRKRSFRVKKPRGAGGGHFGTFKTALDAAHAFRAFMTSANMTDTPQ